MNNFEDKKQRAVEKLTSTSQNDFQKEYNYLYTEYQEYTSKVEELQTTLKDMTEFYTNLIEKYKSKRDFIKDQTEDVIKAAKKEGFKIKEKSLKYY